MGDTMTYYQWPTVAAFNAWHDEVCTLLDLPMPGVNQATGEYDLDAMWTMVYTVCVEVAPGDVRASVDDDMAAAVPDGLGVPCDPPPTLEHMDAEAVGGQSGA